MTSTTAPLGSTFLLSNSMFTGKRGFQRRAAITAGRVGLVAADADQADAEIAHRAFEQLLAIVAQITGREVADENGVVALHFSQRVGETC